MNGKEAERWAAGYLQRQGLILIAENFHSYYGEIDLIMQHADTLVFVEVRQRSSDDFGGAASSIDRHKQHRLIRTAQYYLARLGRTPPCRFDVMLMDDEHGCNAEWIINAFEA